MKRLSVLFIEAGIYNVAKLGVLLCWSLMNVLLGGLLLVWHRISARCLQYDRSRIGGGATMVLSRIGGGATMVLSSIGGGATPSMVLSRTCAIWWPLLNSAPLGHLPCLTSPPCSDFIIVLITDLSPVCHINAA